MDDNPATLNVHRAHLLRLAITTQKRLDPTDAIDRYAHREGLRDGYVHAAAMAIAGRSGATAAATAAAERVIDLLRDGVDDLGVLMETVEPGPREPDDLTWVGPIAFARLAVERPGIDHDLGSRWGPRCDIRISHRRPPNGASGLLYAYDRTWDEYAVLHPAASVAEVDRAYRNALARDPHPPISDFVDILRRATTLRRVDPDGPGVRL